MRETNMTDIKCEVILDSEQVNEFLREHDLPREFGPVAVGTDPEAGSLERNGITHILLGKNRGGVATVLLCYGDSGNGTYKPRVTAIPTSLALLEQVVGDMREAIGQDQRVDLTEGEETPAG